MEDSKTPSAAVITEVRANPKVAGDAGSVNAVSGKRHVLPVPVDAAAQITVSAVDAVAVSGA